MKKIRLFGDPVLTTRAAEVAEFNPSVEHLAVEMVEAVKTTGCLGLAANQLGVIKRVLVYDCGQTQAGAGAVLVNPSWVPVGNQRQIATEQCASLPGLAVEVARFHTVRVSAYDVEGRPVGMVVSGLLARLLQHEIDHLDGVSFLSGLAINERRRVMGTVRNSHWFNK